MTGRSAPTRSRDFDDDFAGAMAFVNGVAEVAEERNHHQDILVHGWNEVRLTLSTHSEGGLTDADERAGAADRRAGERVTPHGVNASPLATLAASP